jgi:hypothetical protein
VQWEEEASGAPFKYCASLTAILMDSIPARFNSAITARITYPIARHVQVQPFALIAEPMPSSTVSGSTALAASVLG